MKKAKIILAVVITVLSFSSYGASCRKKDRCPSVGNFNPKTQTSVNK